MYIIPFLTVTTLLKHLQNRKREQQKNRKNQVPVVPVNRDQIVSMYPLQVVMINNVLGGFFLGAKEVFPNANLSVCINSSDNAMIEKLSGIESAYRFPNANKISKIYTGMFTGADIVFYKVRMITRKGFFTNEVMDWKDKNNIDVFEEGIRKAKNPNFVIEVDYSAKEFPYPGDVIEELKKHVGTLNKYPLNYEVIDACNFTGQSDIRLFITSFPLHPELKRKRLSSFVNNLDPVTKIKDNLLTDDQLRAAILEKSGEVRNIKGNHSATGDFSGDQRYPVKCAKKMSPNPRTRPYLLEDWRLKTDAPIVRYFSLEELERLAGIPTGWIENRENKNVHKLLPMATNMFVAQYIMECFALKYQFKFSTGVYHG